MRTRRSWFAEGSRDWMCPGSVWRVLLRIFAGRGRRLEVNFWLPPRAAACGLRLI